MIYGQASLSKWPYFVTKKAKPLIILTMTVLFLMFEILFNAVYNSFFTHWKSFDSHSSLHLSVFLFSLHYIFFDLEKKYSQSKITKKWRKYEIKNLHTLYFIFISIGGCMYYGVKKASLLGCAHKKVLWEPKSLCV